MGLPLEAFVFTHHQSRLVAPARVDTAPEKVSTEVLRDRSEIHLIIQIDVLDMHDSRRGQNRFFIFHDWSGTMGKNMPAATAANDMHTVWMFATVTCATRLTSAEFS